MLNHNIGNAGELYVLAQLAQQGYIAGKTDDGQTLIDIIATDPATLRAVNIQVKTTMNENAQWWMMSKKNEAVFESLWYVLVKLQGIDRQPIFYIFHSSEIGPWLQNDHKEWLAMPKRNGEPRKDSNMRKFRPTPEQLQLSIGNWQRMFKKP